MLLSLAVAPVGVFSVFERPVQAAGRPRAQPDRACALPGAAARMTASATALAEKLR